MSNEPESNEPDAEVPEPPPWRSGHMKFVQITAADHYAAAVQLDEGIAELNAQVRELRSQMRQLADERDDRLAVVSELRFSEAEMKSVLLAQGLSQRVVRPDRWLYSTTEERETWLESHREELADWTIDGPVEHEDGPPPS